MEEIDRRSIIVIVIWIVLFVFYLHWWQTRMIRRPASPVIKKEEKVEKQSSLFSLPQEVGKEIIVESPLYQIVFSTRGGVIKRYALKKYFNRGKEPVTLLPEASSDSESLSCGILTEAKTEQVFLDTLYKVNREKLTLGDKTKEQTLTFETTTPEGIKLIKKFTFDPFSYLIKVALIFKNLSSENLMVGEDLPLTFVWGPGIPTSAGGAPTGQMKGTAIFLNSKVIYNQAGIAQRVKEKFKEYKGEIQWIGIKNKYFAAILIPHQIATRAIIGDIKGEDLIGIPLPPFFIKVGEEKSFYFSLYGGPQDFKLLKEVNIGSRALSLDEIIYFGWRPFRGLSILALKLLQGLYQLVHNYGVAIILLTLIIKLITYPLTHWSLKSTAAFQKLQPQLTRLKEKYKNDPVTLQRETLALYRKARANPVGGCLPLLLQMPIIIALFGTLNYALELRQAKFCLWIRDLSAPDTIFRLGNFPINVLPLLMGVSMYLQSKLTPSTGGEHGKIFSIIMPVFLTFIFWNFPSGLVLYWLLTNLLSIIQQKLREVKSG
jgi:YidC/Oxa1 family membrane protein insertase